MARAATQLPLAEPDASGMLPGAEELVFTEFLLRRAEAGERATKGERTRDRIVAAAARVLETSGYHHLRMADIAREADVATGSLYQYFENKTEITVTVLGEFLQRIESLLLGGPLSSDYEADIRATNLRYVRLYEANVGMMRCLRQLSDEIPEVGELTAGTYREWRRRLAKNLATWSGATGPEAERRMATTAHALFVMGTEFLYDLYVRRDATLVEREPSAEAVAEFLSEFWARVAREGA